MKVRFGVSMGTDVGPEALPDVVDRLEDEGVDSLWFSELVYSPAIDPTVGMSFALARTRHLKVGTSVAVLPGRHPVLVAKQLLSIAALAPKRVLPVFGLRSALPVERDLFVVPDGKRGAVFDESLILLRRVLREDVVSFSGEFFSVRDVEIAPKPAEPVDVWLGGSSPAGYRRIGTHADGWLGSFLTPEETRAALMEIRAAAEKAGRRVPDDHFGINVAVGTGDLPSSVQAAVRARRPDVDPAELVAPDWPALHAMLDGYIDAGLTKFVIRPLGSAGTAGFLDRFVKELLPRQN
ncbi:TIGR03854 family LLM class F420-dependent oxidoreductase [Mycobacterium kyogaense]|uniref:TIGR03854 family LLM class F420-dependent oxidoreductase n=1 Tax=Mycobacterium kyogaense TaxID=2212479 RepID=UPI000DAD45A9|nr:TIGR03854 family LLM class F420-dependent oxidoreductase [Mycobacterium kyogaense]